MAWRLYDPINSEWYDDEIYDTQERCTEAANFYRHEAEVMGDNLELVAEPFDPSEMIEEPAEDD